MGGSTGRVTIALVGAFLFSALAGLTAQAQGEEPWKVTDASNDVKADPAVAPASLTPTVVDIKEFSIESEDEATLVLLIKLGAFALDGSSSSTDGHLSLDIQFALADLATYNLHYFWFGKRDSNDLTLYHLSKPWSAGYRVIRPAGYSYHTAEVEADPSGLVRFTFQKSDLRDGGASTGGRDFGDPKEPLPIDTGAQLSQFRVKAAMYQSASGFNTTIAYQDYAPDTAPASTPYVLQKTVANVDLRIRSGGYYSTVIYGPGLNQSLPFAVENVAGPKRLVKLSYEFLDENAAADGYEVYGPSSVSVPAGEERTYYYALKSPKEYHEPVILRIRGESLGTTAVGNADLRLENGTVMGPDNNQLKFFMKPGYYTEPQCELQDTCYTSGVLSARATSLGAQPEGKISFPGWSNFETDSKTGVPMLLDLTGNVEIQVKVASRTVDLGSRDLTAELRYDSDEQDVADAILLKATRTATVTTSGVVYTFSGLPRTTTALLKAPGDFQLLLTMPDTGDAVEDRKRSEAHPYIVAQDSFIRLPLLELPAEYRNTAVASPFQLGIPETDRDNFVNPGESRLFNITILNYDSMQQRLRITLSPSHAWPVEVLPGKEFDLFSAQSVNLGVLPKAPADAPLNTDFYVWVNATSDNGATTGVRLHLTVVDVPQDDDTGTFKANTEDQQALVKPAQKSPAWGLLAVVAAAGVALAGRRRA